MEAYIKAISYYLPQKTVSNEQLAEEFPEWSVEKITSKIGVNQRHLAAEDETATDMAISAAKRLFDEHRIDKKTIDFVLLCTQSPDYFLPTSSCIIQNELGLPTSCGAVDYNLGCSGFIYGLSIAKGLIAIGVARNVLIITAETYNKHLHYKDKGNRAIFGDAASACLISTDGFAEIKDFSLGTDGRGAENLIVKTGAFRNKSPLNDLTFDSSGNPISGDYLYMNGGEIFNFTAEVIPVLIKDVLRINHLTRDDIDLYVFHQANKYMINYLRKLLELPKDKFYICLEDTGNTVSSTIPIALYQAKKENKLSGNILLAGFGVGYSWGGVILKMQK